MHLLRTLAGLFFDDASLAIAVLVVLGTTVALVRTDAVSDPVLMAFLVGGVIAILLENVVSAARYRN
jgi:hypothetical protein